VDSFETCLQKKKDWLEALLNLGLACWKFEDLDTASDTFGRVLAIQPQNRDAIRALTAIAIERKNPKLALELHQKAQALGERSPELSYNLGLLLQATGDHASAAECYRSAVGQKSDFPQALLNLGHALKASGKEDEARQVWSQAVAADPELAGRYFH
jgi:tetratricopeptide (TPR) repeat protein